MHEPLSRWDVEVARIFLGTMDDLRSRSSLQATEYQTVQCAGLVRRLMLDEHWKEAGGDSGFEPVFRVGAGRRLLGQDSKGRSYWASSPWLDGRLHEVDLDLRERRAKVTAAQFPEVVRPDLLNWQELRAKVPPPLPVKDFLRYRVVLAYELDNGQRPADMVTVRQLVTEFANRLGGVHLDGKKAPASQLLGDAYIAHPDFLRETVGAIGRVVYRALEPLELQIGLRLREQLSGWVSASN